MKITNKFDQLFKTVKLAIINPRSIKTLSQQELKDISRKFNKHEIIKHKINVFKKYAEESPKTLEEHSEMKKIATKLGIRFNRNTRLVIKQHFADTTFFGEPIPIIITKSIKLSSNEKAFIDLGIGYTQSFKGLLNFEKKQHFEQLIITSLRIVIIRGAINKSYYFKDFKMRPLNNCVLIKCSKSKEETILVKTERLSELKKYIDHISREKVEDQTNRK